jgi:hypothetical protein
LPGRPSRLGSPAVLLASALIAAGFPPRAARIEPMTTLRHE